MAGAASSQRRRGRNGLKLSAAARLLEILQYRIRVDRRRLLSWREHEKRLNLPGHDCSIAERVQVSEISQCQ